MATIPSDKAEVKKAETLKHENEKHDLQVHEKDDLAFVDKQIRTITISGSVPISSNKGNDQKPDVLSSSSKLNLNVVGQDQSFKEEKIYSENLVENINNVKIQDEKDDPAKTEEAMMEIDQVIREFLQGGRQRAINWFNGKKEELFKCVIASGNYKTYVRFLNILLFAGKEDEKKVQENPSFEEACRLIHDIDGMFKKIVRSSLGEEGKKYQRLFYLLKLYMFFLKNKCSEEIKDVIKNKFWGVDQEEKDDYTDLYESIEGCISENEKQIKEAIEHYSRAFALRHQRNQEYLLGLSCNNLARAYLKNQKNETKQSNHKQKSEMWVQKSNNFNLKYINLPAHTDSQEELLMADPFYRKLLDEMANHRE